jgi:hypothetical protein
MGHNPFLSSFIVTGDTDTFLTGGTYSTNTLTLTNNTGGTINVTGFTKYKVYTALLTQVGANAPTTVVLENTLGFNVTFNYLSAGFYATDTIVTNDLNKLYYTISADRGSSPSFYNKMGIIQNGPNFGLTIHTYNNGISTDDILNRTPIEIRLYN